MVNFCGTKSVPPTSSIKMRNCQKKLARVYVYTRAYTQIRDRGGWLSPPPPLIGLRRVWEYGQQLCIQRSLICLKHLQLQIFTSLTKNFCLSQMTKSHSGGISYAPALKLLPWAAGAGQLTVWHWADGVFNGLFVLYCYFVTLLWPAQSLLQRFEWRNNTMQTRVQDSLDQPHMPDAKSGYGWDRDDIVGPV